VDAGNMTQGHNGKVEWGTHHQFVREGEEGDYLATNEHGVPYEVPQGSNRYDEKSRYTKRILRLLVVVVFSEYGATRMCTISLYIGLYLLPSLLVCALKNDKFHRLR
jgi:hypothetical protein